MARTILALIAEIVLSIVVALLIGGLGQWFLGGDLAAAVGESARLLFFFMDIGLAVWVVGLVVLTVRRRARPGIGVTLLVALTGVVLNALTVLVVGLVQGGWAPLYLAFAIEAGVAFLIAVLIAAPIIQRVFRVSAARTVETA